MERERDVFSGATLVAGTLIFVLVMALHPNAHEILAASDVRRAAGVNLMVHAVALTGVPVLFLGLLGLWRRLGRGPLATAALVGWGYASVAVTSAAVTSGFVASGLMVELAEAGGAAGAGSGGADAALSHGLLDLASLAIQGFAKVHLVASSLAIVLWSVAILRGGALHRSAGWVGLVAGGAVAFLFFFGGLHLDVHGFGHMVLAQAAWLVWIGVLLCRGREPAPAPAAAG